MVLSLLENTVSLWTILPPLSTHSFSVVPEPGSEADTDVSFVAENFTDP